MSAIAGVLCLDGRPADRVLLETIAQPASGNAVEARGWWHGGAISLAHVLARVTPESRHEQQPLADPGSGCVIVFDGRLDNRSELQRSLPGQRCLLEEQTDAAYMLAAYLEWDDEAPARLLGDFAFAIWDPRSRRLLLACDPLGSRPLYYGAWEDRLTFASTLEQLLQDPALPHEVNEAAVTGYLYGAAWPAEEQTFYHQIRSVPGGHHLSVRNQQFRLTRYWHWPEQPPEPRPPSPTDGEEFRSLLAEAVRCRMRSFQPVGLMLSGGLDSSAIAGMAGHMRRHAGLPPIHAYTVVYDRFPSCDEQTYSAAVAEHCGFPRTCLPADDCWGLSHLEEWLPAFAEPFFGPHDGIQYKVMARARAGGLRVLLTGHGGDHLLGGSPSYLADWLIQGRWRDLHGQIRAQAALKEQSYLRSFAAHALLPALAIRMPRRRPESSAAATAAWAPAGLRPSAHRPRPRPPRRARDAWWYELRDRLRQFSLNSYQGYRDRMARRFGLEVWQPLLDIRLMEFVLSAPPEALYRDGTSKWLLRESVGDLMPAMVRDRRDKPSLGPLIHHGLRRQRRAFIEALLVDSELEQRRYILPGPWRSSIHRYLDGDDQLLAICWRSLTLEMWLRWHAGRLPPLEREECVPGPAQAFTGPGTALRAQGESR